MRYGESFKMWDMVSLLKCEKWWDPRKLHCFKTSDNTLYIFVQLIFKTCKQKIMKNIIMNLMEKIYLGFFTWSMALNLFGDPAIPLELREERLLLVSHPVIKSIGAYQLQLDDVCKGFPSKVDSDTAIKSDICHF